MNVELAGARHVTRWEADDSGAGYIVALSCAHRIRVFALPGPEMRCAVCLGRLVSQIREIMMLQEPA